MNLKRLNSKNLFIITGLICVFIQYHSYSHAQNSEFDLPRDSKNTLNFSADEQAWIKNNPILKATNQSTWAPIDFIQNGKAAGYSVDYLNLIAEKIGIKIDYVNGYQWSKLLDLLKKREIDIAHSITFTENRGQYLDFTAPYLELRKVFFGHKGNASINNIQDLEGKRIGVIGVWAKSENIRERYPTLNFVDFNNSEDAMSALSVGQIDIYSVRYLIGNYIIKQNFYDEIDMIGRDLFDQNASNNFVRLASRNDEPLLISILNKGMTAITEEEKNALARKWRYEFYADSQINLSSEELEWLSNNPVIRVASDPNGAPLEFINSESKVSGIAGAYLKEIEERIGIEFKWIGNETWKHGLNAIESKEADIISVVTPTNNRDSFLNFTDSYLNVSHMIFGRDGGEVFGNMDGLKGYEIVQVKGNAINEFIKRDYPNLKITEVDSAIEALKLLSIGEVDAYIASIPVASQKIASEGLTNIVVAGETPYRGEYAIGIRSDLVHLSSAMQKAMHSFTDQEIAEISRNWLVLKIEEEKIDPLTFQIFIISIIALLIILVWNYSLRLEVKRRKDVEKKLILSQEKAEFAQAEAETANAAKSAFLANMSHEIRTPLNAIIGFSDAMIMGIFGEIKEPRYQTYLADIKDSGEHLATVINDILDLSKIEAGKWKLNETIFPIHNCIEESISILTLQAKSKNIEIKFDLGMEQTPLYVFGDMNAIKRTLINLLSNAVKFTGNEGLIKCHTELSIDGNLKISVIDTGIGIPEDRLEHVLNPFEQCEEESYINEEGTGLGLSIVKKLTELHQGTFILESDVGIGTSATIVIPETRIIIDDAISFKNKVTSN